MRIDAYNQVSQIYQTMGTKKTNNTQKASGKDQVTISRTGAAYQLAQQAVKSVPDVREELVADLKQRIDAGTYDVSGEAFADKLLKRYGELQNF